MTTDTIPAPKPRKLTTLEKRAKAMCDDLRRHEGAHLTVEWKRSAMYGSNPSLEWCGAVVARASGCGYCKLSTVLAESLRFLGRTDEEQMSIWRTGGAGVFSVQNALAAIRWTLEGVASSRTSDSYVLKPA